MGARQDRFGGSRPDGAGVVRRTRRLGPRRTLQLLMLAAAVLSLVLALSGVLGSTFIVAGP